MKTHHVLILIAPFAAACSVNGLTLVRDGQPAATIVVPKEPSFGVKAGGEYLTNYVHKMTGAELPVVTEGANVKGAVVVLGPCAALARYGVGTDGLEYDDWFIRSGRDFLAIVGRDVDWGPDAWRSCIGTFNGVIAFLEDYCGVRTYMPCELGEFVRPRRTLSVPDTIVVHGRKSVLWGGPSLPAGGWNRRYIRWRLAPGVRYKSHGGHSWAAAIPVKDYFAEHPEYFALVKGKRNDNWQSSLCVTHPDVLKLKIAWAEKLLEDYDCIEIGHPDGYREGSDYCPPCECEKCRGLGEIKDRVYGFHKQVAEAVRKSRPGKMLVMTAYQETAVPRPDWRFPDNVLIESCGRAARPVSEWAKIHDRYAAYVYNWYPWRHSFGPQFSLNRVRQTFENLKQFNMRLVYYCSSGANWGVEWPQYYLDYRLRMNWDDDPERILNEACRDMYGPAADTMREFFAWIDTCQGLSGRESDDPVRRKDKREEEFLRRWPPENTGRALALLERAVQAAGADEAVKARIELARPSLEYVVRMYAGYKAHRDYLAAGKSQESYRRLAAAVGERNRWIDAFVAKQESGYYRDRGLLDPFQRRKTGVHQGIERTVKSDLLMNTSSHNRYREPWNMDFTATVKTQAEQEEALRKQREDIRRVELMTP
ncbi:MAG: DUF4838 domain-containing protein [Kiritimatiellae bacterium]|nr:DUF4838 domain-containing protein [Kiritimatiellia bacterium]